MQRSKLRDEAFDSYESSSFDVDAAQTREATELARSYLMRKVADPELRAKLMPDYPVGCKRPLQSQGVVSHLCAAERPRWRRPRSPS